MAVIAGAHQTSLVQHAEEQILLLSWLAGHTNQGAMEVLAPMALTHLAFYSQPFTFRPDLMHKHVVMYSAACDYKEWSIAAYKNTSEAPFGLGTEG